MGDLMLSYALRLISLAAWGCFVCSVVIATGILVGHFHPDHDRAETAVLVAFSALGFLKLGDLVKGYLVWLESLPTNDRNNG